MQKDVRECARNRLRCQRPKIHHRNKIPIGSFETPDAQFSHVHVDIWGPLPSSKNYRYILTIVGRFTRWPKTIPLVDLTYWRLFNTGLLNTVLQNSSRRTGVRNLKLRYFK